MCIWELQHWVLPILLVDLCNPRCSILAHPVILHCLKEAKRCSTDVAFGDAARILAMFSAVYTEVRKTPHHIAYHVSAAFREVARWRSGRRSVILSCSAKVGKQQQKTRGGLQWSAKEEAQRCSAGPARSSRKCTLAWIVIAKWLATLQ